MKLSELARATLLSIGLIPASLMAEGVSEFNEDVNIRSYARVTGQFQHSASGGNGYLGDAWMPLFGSPRSASFVNLQAYDYANQYRTYGAGVGHRHAVGNTVLGGYAFYDKQYSPNQNTYDRYTVGAEMLGQHVQARANYYFLGQPKSQQLQDLGTTASIQGNHIIVRQTLLNELVHSGADAELGYSINPAISVYAGGYYYSDKLSGYKARIRYRFAGHVELNAATQYDDARGWLTTFGLGYWLGKPFSDDNTVLDRLRENVVRDMTVATTEQIKHVNTQLDSNIYFVGNGTSDNQDAAQEETSFAAAVAKAKAGDLIFINYGDGSDISLNGAVTLNVPNLNVVTSATGLSVMYGGKRYTLIQGDASKTPTLIEGGLVIEAPTTLSGFNMVGNLSTVDDGIDIENAGKVTISHVNVSNYNGAGIEVDGPQSDVTLVNVSSVANGEDGVTIGRTGAQGAGSQVTVQGGEFSRNGGYGVYAEGENTQVTLNNTVIASNVDIGGNSHGIGAFSAAKIVGNDVELSVDPNLSGPSLLVEAGLGDASIELNKGSITGVAKKLTMLTNGGQITINDPTTLVGNLRIPASGSDSIHVTFADGQSYKAEGAVTTIKCNYPTDNPACTT